ncbi:hypothetical protein AQUCO_02100066v1 [Aquilegia coerulea]|uniref:YGGT family protein n=1 Tax=Aquilegia coerulea TaxID=218851 RepID=A0A2G5DEQ1_AQUCA|nr:hypothetical protein AQUCO_02100066v1 [Aquilegia coerulea]
MASLITSSSSSSTFAILNNNNNKSYYFRPNSFSPPLSYSKKFISPSLIRVTASSSTTTPPSLHLKPNPSTNKKNNNPFPSSSSSTLISDSTRTIATIFAIGISLSKLFAQAIQGISLTTFCMNPTSEEFAEIQKLQGNLVCTLGPLFFASIRDRPDGYLNTPLTVVAAGISKWLDIYSGVLMVRVLLSWFPNIPWDRQPLSAIRDLCDPYLNLFRNIIPPVFNTLDVSPIIAFTVLGVLANLLHNIRLTC